MQVASYSQPGARARGHSRRLYYCGLAALGAATFLYLNIGTTMSVLPWTDEVMQIDAAVNLYFGHGWVSTAWQSQSQHEFWAANNPLYTLLVYGWIEIFGFSPVAVRTLNFALAILVTILIVDTTTRARLITAAWAQLMLAVLLLSDDALAFVYRSGRADLVTMLAVGVLARAFLLTEPGRRRVTLLFLCSVPLLAAGLHSIPYAALLLILHLIVTRRFRLTDVAAIAAGCLVGGLGLVALYLSQHALVAYLSQTLASGYNIVGAAWQAVSFRDPAAIGRLLTLLSALSPVHVTRTVGADLGLSLLIAFMAAALAISWKERGSSIRSAAAIGILAALLIPYGMLAAGRYAYYYAWMGAAPVAVVFVRLLEQCWLGARWRIWSTGCAIAVAAALAGMPLAIWKEVRRVPSTSYSAAQQLFRKEARPGDVVYGDPVFYYEAKSAGLHFYALTYSGGRGYRRMSDAERQGVSLALVEKSQVADALEKLGGAWTTQSSRLVLPGGEPIVVMRRAAENLHE